MTFLRYTLTGVDIKSDDVQGDSFSASVCTVGSDGFPTSSCTALTAPGSFAAGTLGFTASPSIVLTAGTKYAVVMDPGSNTVSFDTTDSGSEDMGAAAGWGIKNDYFTHLGGSWFETTSFSFRIAVKGNLKAAPTASNSTVTTVEDTAYTFKASDFNFSDDDAGDTLASVKITTLESHGALKLDGTDVVLNEVVTKADIDGGKLTFTPVAGATGTGYATFGFKVNDGAVDSASAYTMTIDVKVSPTDDTLSALTLDLAPGDPQLRHLDRAWASTVHAFQGRTVDTVIAAMEANHPHLTTQKSFYVEISRARDKAELVTDDKAALKEQLEAATGERIAALEAIEPDRTKGREAGLDGGRSVEPEGEASGSRGRDRASEPAMEQSRGPNGLDRGLGL